MGFIRKWLTGCGPANSAMTVYLRKNSIVNEAGYLNWSSES